MKKTLVKIDDYRLSFKQKGTSVNKLVLRNTGIELYEGEILALVGESGSGKTVITSAALGLLGDAKVVENGSVIVDGVDVTEYTNKDWEKSKLRGKVISSVFQNPMTTLNPTMKIGKQIMETALVNGVASSKEEAYDMAIDFLTRVKIDRPEMVMKLYPHQLSGGMKQRVVISAVLIAKPKILILDEPTTALDPTIQSEIIKIVVELQKEFKTSIIFITHDIGVVASIADRIAVMYAGKVIEYGKVDEILWNLKHPYTWGLLMSMPDVNFEEKLAIIPGMVPGVLNGIKGDAFAPRNAFALHKDFEEHPPFFDISETHKVASWLYHKDAPKFEPPAIIAGRWKEFKKSKVGKKNGKRK